MPTKPPRPCKHPRCPYLVYPPYRYCEEHRHLDRRYPDTRVSAARRGYGYGWQKIRNRYIKKHPNCQLCGVRGELVDHITPKPEGSDDDSNLQTLCMRCHAKKTARDMRMR